MNLTAEELLAGSNVTHEVQLPSELLSDKGDGLVQGGVVLRPLTVGDVQRIGKAARDDDTLSAALMLQLALVQPTLNAEQVARLPAGMARFLVERINAISGMNMARDALEELVQAPLAKACFVLAREFGWSPEEVSGMTLGQILLYLQMSRERSNSA